MAKKISLIILLGSSLPLILHLPGWFGLISGSIQAFILPGFVLLLFLGERERHWFDDIVLSALLSPILLTASTLLIAGFGLPMERSLRFFLFLVYLFLGIALVAGRFKNTGAKLRVPWSIPVVCAGFAGLIAACFAVNPDLLRRSDAWYHASLVSEILARGVPPMEPVLADFPIKYMWYYHLFIASLIKLSHIPIFAAMGLFNVMAAFSFPYLLARYASFFTKNARKITFAVLMAMAGLEAVSWFLWPVELVRALTGDVRGMEEVIRTFGKIEFHNSSVIYSLAPFGTWMVNLPDKFLTITVFSYSLGLFLLGVFLVLTAWREGSAGIRGAIILLASVFGTMIFHVVTGVTMIGTVIGSSVLAILYLRLRKRAGIQAGLSAVIPLAVILGFGLSIPFLSRIDMSAGAGSGNFIADHLHFGLKNFLTIFLPFLILIGPIRGTFKKHFSRHAAPEYVFVSGMIICLLILNIFIDLPSVNESKFIFPLFLLAGPPVFVEIVGRIRNSGGAKKRAMVILTLFLFLPAPFLTFRGFIIDRPTDKTELKRVTVQPAEREAFEWLRDNSGMEAVVIENNFYHLAPVLALRHSFNSNMGIVGVLGYDRNKLDEMEMIKTDLFSDHPIAEETESFLRNMGREIYVVLLDEDVKEHPALSGKFLSDAGRFEQVFNNGKTRVYRLR